jgi:tryptophan-rich sensory protein
MGLALALDSMPAWLVIAAWMVLVILVLTPSRREFRWFLQLRRPRWLTFERWIPAIWLVIYLCFFASALQAWAASGSGRLLAAYLGLLVLVQSYTWVICRTRRLRYGTLVGLAGWLWGMVLAAALLPISRPAALLLVPYLLWSPVGTFVTYRMERLNN